MALSVKEVTWYSLPVERFNRYTFHEPLRLLWNTIQFKSGDQNGLMSSCASEVNWRSVPLPIFRLNKSQLPLRSLWKMSVPLSGPTMALMLLDFVFVRRVCV